MIDQRLPRHHEQRRTRRVIGYTRRRDSDLLVIDDRATVHPAHGDYDRSVSQILWRIIVEGDPLIAA